jgi:hypothetical protein
MPSKSISARAPILLGFSHVAVRRGRPVMLKAGVCTGAGGAPSLVAFGGDVEGQREVGFEVVPVVVSEVCIFIGLFKFKCDYLNINLTV